MKTSAKTLWDSLRTSYWFVPTLMVLAGAALWIAVFQIDLTLRHRIEKTWWLYTGGPEGARSLLSALIQAMITVAGVTFSITIVVLTLASQQFGPLLLRNFLRDKGSQIVLGTFVSTFIFCLLALRTVRGPGGEDFVPQASVTAAVVLGIASIAVLVYFVHHISVLIQAPNLIDVVYDDLDETIERIFPEKAADLSDAVDDEQDREIASRFDSGAGIVKSACRGYVKGIELEMLLKAASGRDLVIRLIQYPGDFVIPGSDLVSVLPEDAVNNELTGKINESYIFGAGRTATQDIDFLFSQLVEIAVRALSPGINDPFTAVVCIDHLCAALCKLAGRALPSPYRRDKDGKVRVIAFPVTFARLVDAGLGPIRHYGRTHPSVLARLLWSISVTARYVHRDEDRAALIGHAEAIKKSALDSIQSEEDRRIIINKYNQASQALGAV